MSTRKKKILETLEDMGLVPVDKDENNTPEKEDEDVIDEARAEDRTKGALRKKTEIKEDSAAEATLAPNSKPADDPKSRFEMIAAMLGAFHTMRDEHLTAMYDAMIGQIGQEAANIPSGAAAQNQSTITTKPSAALGNGAGAVKESVSNDMSKILSETEGLSEDFKLKASTLFEAAIEARLNVDRVALQEAFEVQLDETVTEIRNEIYEDLDSYFDYVAKKWISENEVAIESSLRNEILEDFMHGMKEVFQENFIDVPEEKVDVIESLAEKVEELENALSEVISENTKLVGKIEEQVREQAILEAAKNLTVVEQEKLRELAESIEFTDIDTFSKKLGIIRESHFIRKVNSQVLSESLEDVKEENKSLQTEVKKHISPEMQVYLETIKRTKGQSLKI